MGAWLLLDNQLICILWQELSHWPSKLSRENPSTGETHAGLIRRPPAINQWEQCILGVGGNSCLKIAEGDWPQMWNVGHGCQFYRLDIVDMEHTATHSRFCPLTLTLAPAFDS